MFFLNYLYTRFAKMPRSYLWDFLSILSEIERNYLLDDDRDGSSSGADGMIFG